MQTEVVHTRIDAATKKAAKAALAPLGLTLSMATKLFLKQVAYHKGLPFSLNIPNKTTEQAMREAAAGRNLRLFESFEDWQKDFRKNILKKEPARARRRSAKKV